MARPHCAHAMMRPVPPSTARTRGGVNFGENRGRQDADEDPRLDKVTRIPIYSKN